MHSTALMAGPNLQRQKANMNGRQRPHREVRLDTDITRLLAAAAQRPRPLTAATYHTLVGLMAVTGMRVGEAVGLNVDDVGPA